MADAIIERRHGDHVPEIARRIARRAPKLADLGTKELKRLVPVVVAEGLRDELRAAVRVEKIDYHAERELFIARASRTGSARTEKL